VSRKSWPRSIFVWIPILNSFNWRPRTNVFYHNYNRCSCIVPPGPHRDFSVEPPAQKGSDDSNEANCTNAEALKWLQCCTQSAKNAENGRNSTFSDRNLREEKLSFKPDQPEGNLFWVTTKLFAEKNSLKQYFFCPLIAYCIKLHNIWCSALAVISEKHVPETVSSKLQLMHSTKCETWHSWKWEW